MPVIPSNNGRYLSFVTAGVNVSLQLILIWDLPWLTRSGEPAYRLARAGSRLCLGGSLPTYASVYLGKGSGELH